VTLPYDVITVGGGLAGSAVAKCLAEHGYRVLVLERERRFRDRVRGEQMHPWGVAEARTLGLYQRLVDRVGIKHAGGPRIRVPRRFAEGTWCRRRLIKSVRSTSITPTCRKR
jgi:flavin-dependent dehydrogenase